MNKIYWHLNFVTVDIWPNFWVNHVPHSCVMSWRPQLARCWSGGCSVPHCWVPWCHLFLRLRRSCCCTLPLLGVYAEFPWAKRASIDCFWGHIFPLQKLKWKWIHVNQQIATFNFLQSRSIFTSITDNNCKLSIVGTIKAINHNQKNSNSAFRGNNSFL